MSMMSLATCAAGEATFDNLEAGDYVATLDPDTDYYAVVKGNAPTDKGAFSLAIRDVTNRPLTSVACNNDPSYSVDTSRITTSLNAGTYYVALKGRTSTQKGPYQLSIGAGTTHSSTYSPPTWYDTLSAVQTTMSTASERWRSQL